VGPLGVTAPHRIEISFAPAPRLSRLRPSSDLSTGSLPRELPRAGGDGRGLPRSCGVGRGLPRAGGSGGRGLPRAEGGVRCAGHALTGGEGVAPRLRVCPARPGNLTASCRPHLADRVLPAASCRPRLADRVSPAARAESHWEGDHVLPAWATAVALLAAGLGAGGLAVGLAAAASLLAVAGRSAGRRAIPRTRLLLYFLLRT
jgi:hypothetical protein